MLTVFGSSTIQPIIGSVRCFRLIQKLLSMNRSICLDWNFYFYKHIHSGSRHLLQIYQVWLVLNCIKTQASWLGSMFGHYSTLTKTFNQVFKHFARFGWRYDYNMKVSFQSFQYYTITNHTLQYCIKLTCGQNKLRDQSFRGLLLEYG